MANGQVGREQFPVEHAVPGCSSTQTAAEKAEWMPPSSHKLFQNHADADIEGIGPQSMGSCRVGVEQVAATPKKTLAD